MSTDIERKHTIETAQTEQQPTPWTSTLGDRGLGLVAAERVDSASWRARSPQSPEEIARLHSLGAEIEAHDPVTGIVEY